MRRNADIIIISSVIIGLLLLRIIIFLELLNLGISIMTLLSQGYLLFAALFPRRNIFRSPFIFIIPLLSIAISSLFYILISYMVGFTPEHYFLGLIIYVITFILIIIIRRHKHSEADGVAPTNKLPKLHINIELVLLTTAIITFLGLLVLSRKTGVRYSEFFIVDDNGQMERFPESVILGDNLNLSYIVVNHSDLTIQYELYYEINNKSRMKIDEFDLAQASSVRNKLSLSIKSAGINKITLDLIEKDRPMNQYQLIYWVTVKW